MKNFFILIFVFLIIGETVIRLDRFFLFFHTNRFVKIETRHHPSIELEMISKREFPISDNDLRIMVLGDSKIYGAGIEFKKTFSQQLKTLLLSNLKTKFENIYVLDISKPGYNTLRNRIDYFKYCDLFKPHIVILGYNSNDVYGKQDEVNGNKTKSTKSDQPLGRKIKHALYQSKLINFTLHNLYMELKANGIIIPGSEFHHNIYTSHSPDYKGWQKSKKHLESIIYDCDQNNSKLIVLFIPELNTLENKKLLMPLQKRLASIFNNYPVLYIDGITPFLNERSEDISMSKYDGHPNERAHKIFSQYIYKIITEVFEDIDQLKISKANY